MNRDTQHMQPVIIVNVFEPPRAILAGRVAVIFR